VAGYRLSRFAWIFVIVFACYLSSYLPGEGQVYIYLDIVIVFTAIVSIAAYRAFSWPLELPDSKWPEYRPAEA
jgi:hypothetical protein